MRDQYYQETLRFVNRIRLEKGYALLEKLEPGKVLDHTACPLANSIRKENNLKVVIEKAPVQVNGVPVYFQDLKELYLVVGFVRRFDQGKYPELIKKNA